MIPKNWKNDKIEEIVLVSPTHRQLVLLWWPNVAIYYTVMIIDFQDEMLIFMEYCAHGTIADVAKLGLSEGMVRKYTADILGAVSVLHENGIVHRDIKGRLIHGGLAMHIYTSELIMVMAWHLFVSEAMFTSDLGG